MTNGSEDGSGRVHPMPCAVCAKAPQVGHVYDTHATVQVTAVDGRLVTVWNGETSSVVDRAEMARWTRVA